jgi:hypothetical protein
VVGEPSSRSTLQRITHKPQGVRTEHEVFVNWANDSITASMAESGQILRDLGQDPAAAARGGSPTRSPDKRRGASPDPRARSVSPSVAYTAARNAPMSAGIVLSETMAQEASLGRARSARDLFAALSDGSTSALAEYSIGASSSMALQDTSAGGKALPPASETEVQPRVISVREFQRGTSVVKPARPLPFPGPDSLSPGERKRAQAAARSAGREKIPPVGARGEPKPTLADGVTSMLTGVRGDLGEILTAPVSPFSSFDNLLDRLVDTPEACFVNPSSLPWSPVVVAGRAAQPTGHRNVRGAYSFRT